MQWRKEGQKNKKTKNKQTSIYKTLSRKLHIENISSAKKKLSVSLKR
jgi:hypothetical protein